MLFGPPRGLRHGKTSWNMLTAACEFSSTVRASGHVGIAVTVYIMDGLLYSASVRLFKARHALWYDVLQQRGDAFDPLERCRDLVVGIRCKAHGFHNAVSWGLGSHTNEEVINEAHISVASLLNCSSAIYERIDRFLLRAVRFVVKKRPRGCRGILATSRSQGRDDSALCSVRPALERNSSRSG